MSIPNHIGAYLRTGSSIEHYAITYTSNGGAIAITAISKANNKPVPITEELREQAMEYAQQFEMVSNTAKP